MEYTSEQPRKRLFMALLSLSLLFMAFLGYAVWRIAYLGLMEINSYLPRQGLPEKDFDCSFWQFA